MNHEKETRVREDPEDVVVDEESHRKRQRESRGVGNLQSSRVSSQKSEEKKR